MTTKWDCFWKPWNIIFTWSFPASSYMLMLVSIDRWYATFYPLQYITLTSRYAWRMLASLAVFTLLHAITSGSLTFFLNKNDAVPSFCLPIHGENPIYSEYVAYARIIPPFISVVLYQFIALRIRKVSLLRLLITSKCVKYE
jgi:hypothetical protein